MTNSRRAVRQSQRTDAQLVADQALIRAGRAQRARPSQRRKPVSRTSMGWWVGKSNVGAEGCLRPNGDGQSNPPLRHHSPSNHPSASHCRHSVTASLRGNVCVALSSTAVPATTVRQHRSLAPSSAKSWQHISMTRTIPTMTMLMRMTDGDRMTMNDNSGHAFFTRRNPSSPCQEEGGAR